MLALGCAFSFIPNSQRNWELEFLNITLLHIIYKHFQIFANSLKSWEIGIFYVSWLSDFVRLGSLGFCRKQAIGQLFVEDVYIFQ